MKKTLKVLGLLVVAAVLFAGCKNNTDEGSGEKNLQEALFDPADLTVDATSYVYTDGAWTYRSITDYGEDFDANQLEFSIKNNTLDETAGITYIDSRKGTIPEGYMTEADKKAAEEYGYKIDGNKYSFYKEYDVIELNKKYETDSEFQTKVRAASQGQSTMDPEVIAYGTSYEILFNLVEGLPYTGTKTNADNSKYYYTRSGTEHGRDYNVKKYLAKN